MASSAWKPVAGDTSAWKPVEPAEVSTPEKPGYFETLGHDLMGSLGALRHPIDTSVAIYKNSLEHAHQAYASMKEGKFEEASDHLVQAIPILGPLAYETRNDIESGNNARALARMTELIAPKVIGKGIEVAPAVGRGIAKVVTNPHVIKAAGAAMGAAATHATGIPGLELAGALVGHELAGAVAGKVVKPPIEPVVIPTSPEMVAPVVESVPPTPPPPGPIRPPLAQPAPVEAAPIEAPAPVEPWTPDPADVAAERAFKQGLIDLRNKAQGAPLAAETPAAPVPTETPSDLEVALQESLKNAKKGDPNAAVPQSAPGKSLNAELKAQAAETSEGFKEAAQLRRAHTIGKFIKDYLGEHYDQASIGEQLSDEHIRAAAEGAGVKNPSTATIQKVRELFKMGAEPGKTKSIGGLMQELK